MVKLKFVIKDDTLVLRISEGKMRFYRSAMAILAGSPNLSRHWNADKERFSCSSPFYKENNKALESFKKNFSDVVLANPLLSAKDVSMYFDKPASPKSEIVDCTLVRPFLVRLIEREKTKPGCNFETYGKILRKCDRILPDFAKLSFKDIDYDKCVEIAGVLAMHNGYAHSAKQFRNMLGKASKDRSVPFKISQIGEFRFSDYDPDKDRNLGNTPDVLTPAQVTRFLNMNPYCMTPGYDRNTVILYYDFCVFMLNSFMAPCDVINLKKENVIEGKTIRYRRKKTHRLVELPITSAMGRIISKYSGLSQDKYIFPIMDDELEGTYKTKDYLFKKFRERLNIWLKDVGKDLGMSYDLYAYVFRHTAITMALDNGLPISYVSLVAGTDIEMIQDHYYNGESVTNSQKLDMMFAKAARV